MCEIKYSTSVPWPENNITNKMIIEHKEKDIDKKKNIFKCVVSVPAVKNKENLFIIKKINT